MWLALACAGIFVPAWGDAATRSFVVSYFYPADYYAADTCPEGLNPLPDVFFKRDLALLGLPQTEVDRMFDTDYNNQNVQNKTPWVAVVATRGNGRDNVYTHPTTVPDAHLRPAVGRYAYGFNLDGLGAASPHSYEDPETHAVGVNNQLFHAIGCIQVYKGYPPPQPPLEPEYRWDASRGVMGAWLISIEAADFGKDGPVTVRLETSVDPVTTQDAAAHVRADMTYRVAPHPAAINILAGELKDGVITTEPTEIRMVCDAYIQPVYEFRKARLRLKIKPDGTVEGVLGGYAPWYPIYWSHAKVGYIDERGFGIDAPALYYALRRDADADPDPTTHENTAISAAYMIEAVPAFVAPLAPAPEVATARTSAATASPRREPTLRAQAPADAEPSHGAEPAIPGAPAVARRLRPDQYRHLIADVFGPAIKVEGRFEPDIRDAGLLAVGAAHVGVTATGLDQYDAMARGIAAQVVDEAHRKTLIPCTPAVATAADDACARRFFSAVGPLLLRRPLGEAELAQAAELAGLTAGSVHSFYAGLAASLAGMLESPAFLFREERLEPDPGHPGSYRLDAYAKASQLSFFLWNAGPDPLLLRAAAAGELDTRTGLLRQVDRMLTSPRLEDGMRAFFADMLEFDLFDTLAKDATIYPKWIARVGVDAQEQTLRTIVDLLLNQHGDYRDLFTTRVTYLTPLLGSIYRVPLPTSTALWQRYEFPADDARTGIQTQASFVALHSHEGLSSPTLRGKAIRELLLCEPVPSPPGNVNFAGAEDTHNPDFKTMRARLTAHRTDPTCAGCHKLMDPMGLALENFDSDAGFRTSENGQALDTSGELDGVRFDDSSGLGRALHDNPATGACLVRRLYSYATGRAATRRDMPWIRSLELGFKSDGYRATDLMRRIAISENLYRVSAPERAAPATPLTAMSGEENVK